MAALSWPEFDRAAADIAAIGKGLLYHPDRGEVGILATVDSDGRPRVAPVAPIFCATGLYLSVGAHTPKFAHLEHDQRYALHALVGADDLEFQIGGVVRRVEAADERDAVVAAIPFPSYDANDPIYELLIERALSVTWPQPGTSEKKTWTAR